MNHALVIGVASTRYGDGIFAPLPGVDHDVAEVSTLLMRRNFAVTVCGSGDDTRANTIAGLLGRFVDLTAAGDLGVIYLAGHGYRIPDASSDESDGWDEVFVCSDEPIPDDWFRSALWARLRPAARIVVIVDACHSTTVTLGLSDRAPVPMPTPINSDYFRLTLCACRDEETTVEHARRDEGGGVCTREMLELVNAQPTIPYGELWAQTATQVRDRYPSSDAGTPQLLYHGADSSLLEAAALLPLSAGA